MSNLDNPESVPPPPTTVPDELRGLGHAAERAGGALDGLVRELNNAGEILSALYRSTPRWRILRRWNISRAIRAIGGVQ